MNYRKFLESKLGSFIGKVRFVRVLIMKLYIRQQKKIKFAIVPEQAFKGLKLSKFQPDKHAESILYFEGIEWNNGKFERKDFELSFAEKGRIRTNFGDFVIIGDKESEFDPESVKNIDLDFGDCSKFFEHEYRKNYLKELHEKLLTGEVSLEEYIKEYTK